MHRLRLFALLCASVTIIVASCGRSTPGPSPSPPDKAPALAFQKLLAFVPQDWYDQHPPDIHGPPVYFLDFQAMRADLNLPEVFGSDTRAAKLPLITGISTQGLEFTPDAIDPLSATAYDTWGWDIADLSQALFIPDQQTAILRGNFNKETIRLITFQASSGVTDLSFIYHYSSKDEAAKDVALVRATLTKTPSFQNPSATWGDLIQLESVKVDGTLIVARGKTKSKNLIGYSLDFRDEAGFLPARPIQ